MLQRGKNIGVETRNQEASKTRIRKYRMQTQDTGESSPMMMVKENSRTIAGQENNQ